ncbi:mechanosensitive ion channel family protein [Flavihumibacter sp. RY-1]|uniref:Mechanosensitive ion channel family protein n=1 Tax=Flavihumibacter fluminis TaxID=2909236 RepID=A0ABS9BK10_9BACT|nr:mechanosensitive ion channel family protein [Flavihumibacter fluminis]MCF1715343.1 mechanosensitive ion channel family protein [Flavihumibacter fluminis]
MREYLNQTFWGNTYLAYLIAAAGILVAWIIVRLVKKYAVKKLQQLVSSTDNQYDDMVIEGVEKFVIPYIYLFVNYNIITHLNLHPRLANIFRVAITVITLYYAVRLVNHILGAMLKGFMERRHETPERIRQLRGVMIVLKAIVWFLGIVLLLDNLGYDVATIIAGMGIGGIAIALAAQTILGDLFSYFVIFFDKPFEIGDFVNADGKIGTVEYIGIKTTRIRSITGEQVIMSNTKLTNTALHNFKRMERRRIAFTIGVTYQTPAEKLKQIPGIIEKAIKAQSIAAFDRSHLSAFGDFSINFETVYFIETPDYLAFMNAQQEIYQAIFEAFEKEGIDFAYPTQTLFLERASQDTAAKTTE